MYIGVYLKKQSSSQCVTVTEYKRDDTTLILDDEQDACSLNNTWLTVRYKLADSLLSPVHGSDHEVDPRIQ